ncbi:MAG: LamG-like jellyroll fold domain-containing protein, partial [Candidatus Hydrogenedentales bacterium]
MHFNATPASISRVLFVLALAGVFAHAAPDPQEGAWGNALDARNGAMAMAADPAYGRLPVTVECRVKLLGSDQYNIIVANETKASATHWEVFTTPGDGVLHAYLPGRSPDHTHTAMRITDGKWHCIAPVMEEARVRLVVDGVEAGNTEAAAPSQPGTPGPLAIGSLAEGGFFCNGFIDA